jgi:hypothetical protein
MPAEHPTAHSGAPLTPRPRYRGKILGGIDAARLHEAAAEHTNHQLLDALIGIHSELAAMRDSVKSVRRRILWSGSAQIGPAGTWNRRLPQGSMAIAVTNFSANNLVTVAAGDPAGTAPGLGAGVHNVPAGVFAVFNNDTVGWTLYGTPGNICDVQIFSTPIMPAAAGMI